MTNEVVNVPELRFTGFEDEWKETNLGNIANIVGGGTPKTEIPEYWNGEINWYSPVEIGDRNYVYESKNKITQLGLQKSSAKILPIGTVLFTARAGIGNTAILKKEGATNQGFQSIIPKEGVLDTYFIFSRTNELKRYGEIHGAGSTFVEISGKEMAKMPISIPVIKEQQKIGEFFSKLDRQIELEEQKLSLLEEQKKGYMQKIFSQELRFKDENGNDYPEWEEINLGSLYKKGKAGGTPKSTESKYYNGKVPFLSISDITKQGKFLNITEKKITQEGLDNSTAWLVPVNSINYAMYASVGYLSINKIEVATSQAIFNMVFEDYNLVEYLYYYLNYIRDKGVLEKLMGTGTQSNLSASIMKNITVKLPSKNEIIKTSKFLGNVDELIETQSSKVELLKERKEGLLQKMFV
ncbi:restriction endonuclease subunit S [Staphylococcus cohnii]|uniref:restriction endonuclease subunit S n=1 Tax=Staphylococcus cohnii TaxID=29382 RepID=UPI003D7CEDB4